MSVILRNDYGAVAVNKGVIERMIVEDILAMSDEILLCNKKGKIIKEKPTPFIDPDYFDAIELSDKRGHVRVSINIVMLDELDITDIADRIFSSVEADFDILKLSKPELIAVKSRGIMRGDDVEKRSVEVVRNNA